eukprot:6040373-Amphidinium_carterae.1
MVTLTSSALQRTQLCCRLHSDLISGYGRWLVWGHRHTIEGNLRQDNPGSLKGYLYAQETSLSWPICEYHVHTADFCILFQTFRCKNTQHDTFVLYCKFSASLFQGWFACGSGTLRGILRVSVVTGWQNTSDSCAC